MKIHDWHGVKIAQLGNCLAASYNKPEAIECYIFQHRVAFAAKEVFDEMAKTGPKPGSLTVAVSGAALDAAKPPVTLSDHPEGVAEGVAEGGGRGHARRRSRAAHNGGPLGAHRRLSVDFATAQRSKKAHAWPRRIVFADDNSDNAFNVYNHFAMKQAAEVKERESNSNETTASAVSSTGTTPTTTMTSISSFWYMPPTRSEVFDPATRELFIRMSHHFKDMDRQNTKKQ